MKLQFLLVGILAVYSRWRPVGSCRGDFSGSGFHGGGPGGFQAGGMVFQGGRLNQFQRPGFAGPGRFFNGRFHNFNGHEPGWQTVFDLSRSR